MQDLQITFNIFGSILGTELVGNSPVRKDVR